MRTYSSHSATPITLLTGFLGAGKTTLLNHILHGRHQLRIAVLVNDFGPINIDSQLIAHVDEQAISLRNGCICCSIRGDLLAAVLRLLQSPQPPEYVVIECSGIADPAAVARTFLLPELRHLVRLDSTIAIVDTEQVHTQEDQQDLIADQIAAADIVVLNKIDLASERLREGLREWIRMIVPAARIFETSYCDVPLELLIGVGGESAAFARPEPEHHHEQLFASWSFAAERPFRFAALRQVLAALPPQIFRAKGVLWVAEERQRQVVFQLVGARTALTPGQAWGEEPRRSELVLIGAPGSIDEEWLEQQFRSALAVT